MSAPAPADAVEEVKEMIAAIPKKKRARRKNKPKDPSKPKRPPSRWILHVKATRAASPGMSYKQAMTEASKTYKKVGS